jgi:hypothetical protein
LRLCADCAQRYEQFVEDLDTIGLVLATPPPASAVARVWWPRQTQLMAAATACTLLVAVALGVAWLRQPSRVDAATPRHNTEAFAADLSDALFASDITGVSSVAAEAPYLEAALDAGQPCSGDRFLAGECNDALSAYLIEDD